MVSTATLKKIALGGFVLVGGCGILVKSRIRSEYFISFLYYRSDSEQGQQGQGQGGTGPGFQKTIFRRQQNVSLLGLLGTREGVGATKRECVCVWLGVGGGGAGITPPKIPL